MNHFKIILVSLVLLIQNKTTYSQRSISDSTIAARLHDLRSGLDTILMVRRFESIETPCLCIDENDNEAHSKKGHTNSNFRTRTAQKKDVESGINCLSQNCARYLRFKVKEVDVVNQIIKGQVELTYGYPAGSLIQYLGRTLDSEQPQTNFFEALLRSPGSFKLYPEDDKYKVELVMEADPYNVHDTIYGYMEIVQNVYEKVAQLGYMLFFDQMSLYKGDRNNQIFQRFTSTSFRNESLYYTRLLTDALMPLNNSNGASYLHAKWVQNFFENPECKACHFIYSQAAASLNPNNSRLPNTDPFPAH